MKAAFRVFVSSILHLIAAGNRCVELDSRAAAIQSGDSCTLLRTVVSGGDIFASDTGSVIDATCGLHLEGVDRPACVEEVVDVVAGITDEGCRLTGGANVAEFIYTVNDGRDGFTLLTQLACKQVGECFADIQKAIENCNENSVEEDCFYYPTCDCLGDFLSTIEKISAEDNGDLLQLDSAIIERIQVADTGCRCEDLNYRALSLELSPSCALASTIVQDGDILAGDATVIDDTCRNVTNTCVEDIADVVDGFVEYGCAATEANPSFIYALSGSSEDFKKITEFACNNDCDITLRECQSDSACIKSLSCACKRDFLAIVEGLSSDSREDFLKLDDSVIDGMREVIGECPSSNENQPKPDSLPIGGAVFRESVVVAICVASVSFLLL